MIRSPVIFHALAERPNDARNFPYEGAWSRSFRTWRNRTLMTLGEVRVSPEAVPVGTPKDRRPFALKARLALTKVGAFPRVTHRLRIAQGRADEMGAKRRSSILNHG